MTLPELAKQSIEFYLQNGRFLDLPKSLPLKFSKKGAAFVTLHKKDGDLRGCIGTFLPTQNSLAEEVIKNAVSAAVGDPRFFPVTRDELKDIEISVDVLEKPTNIKNVDELDPKKFGIILTSPDGRCGLLLPDIDGVDTTRDQITITLQKAGINPGESYKIQKFKVIRYK